MFDFFKKAENVGQLRELDALVEDLVYFSASTWWTTIIHSASPRQSMLSSDLWRLLISVSPGMHVVHTYTHTKTVMHTK